VGKKLQDFQGCVGTMINGISGSNNWEERGVRTSSVHLQATSTSWRNTSFRVMTRVTVGSCVALSWFRRSQRNHVQLWTVSRRSHHRWPHALGRRRWHSFPTVVSTGSTDWLSSIKTWTLPQNTNNTSWNFFNFTLFVLKFQSTAIVPFSSYWNKEYDWMRSNVTR